MNRRFIDMDVDEGGSSMHRCRNVSTPDVLREYANWLATLAFETYSVSMVALNGTPLKLTSLFGAA
jgi:hypothetical protein